MKATKIWIAVHPDQPANKEVSFTDPFDSGTHINSDFDDNNDAWAEWVEYACIPLEG